jgi:hypothetical protein
MKERLMATAARSPEALKAVLDIIKAQDAQGWIRHASYALHWSRKRLWLLQDLSQCDLRGHRCRSSLLPAYCKRRPYERQSELAPSLISNRQQILRTTNGSSQF